MARPRKELNGEEVSKLAKLGCTNGEIGDFFGVSDEHIRTRFLAELSLGRADQKTTLRRRQWKAAMSGNVPMLIHLGKQYLGQADKLVTKTETDPLKINITIADDEQRKLKASTDQPS